MNGPWVRWGGCRGEYHGHPRDDTDEFLHVIEGKGRFDLEGRTAELGPRQGFVAPSGVRHRPRAPVRTVVRMAERKGIVPTGT